jgi:hypothetical protein
MRGKILEIGKRITRFFGKVLSEIRFYGFAFSQSDFIKGPVIDSELKLVDGVLNSADSESMSFDLMNKIEVNIEKTEDKCKELLFFVIDLFHVEVDSTLT